MKQINWRTLLLVGLGLIIVVAVLFATTKESSKPQGASETFFEEQTNSEGPVSVTVQPLSVASSQALRFTIKLDTHSEELSHDMVQSAVLIDEKGTEYTPSAWEGDPPGGHHREGVFTFLAVSPLPRTITIKIRNVGGIMERIFTWTVPN